MKKFLFLGLVCVVFGFAFSAHAATTTITNIQVKDETIGANRLVVTWDAVPEAAFYKVFNATDTQYDGGLVRSGTTFILTGPTSGQPYVFKIRAYKAEASDPFAGGDSKPFTTAPSVKTDPKLEVGAPFPGEEGKKVDLIEHIYLAHKWATLIGTLIAAFMIIFAGFKYTTSAGNPEGLQDAKDTLIGALIGLAIIILTYLLLQVLGARVIGVNPPY